MGRIRGVVDPFPKKGRPPSGLFSTNGVQKNDGNASAEHKPLLVSALKSDRLDPAPRDNRIKKG